MKTKSGENRWFLFIVALLFLPATLATATSLTNGGFSNPLNVGWTDYRNVVIDSGEAVLSEDAGFLTFLEQQFAVPQLASSLSFDYLPLFEVGGSESFSVSLLDFVFAPLIPANPDPGNPAETYYYMHDSGGDIFVDSAYVSLSDLGGGWRRVDLDLRSLGGLSTDALLAFDLIGLDASYGTQIRLDNVAVGVGVIPEPTTMMGVLVGITGLARYLRKRHLACGRSHTQDEGESA